MFFKKVQSHIGELIRIRADLSSSQIARRFNGKICLIQEVHFKYGQDESRDRFAMTDLYVDGKIMRKFYLWEDETEFLQGPQ